MSERKVLNKYYPPDFDPSKIPRMKLAKNRQYTVRLMAPFNMRCATCGEYIYKGKKFNARKEDVENQDYLGIRIYRFYIKCTRCLQEISFKTDPQNTDYEIEAGATRNFMALKLAEEQAKREDDEQKEEEANNPMKLLEIRTEQSKQEIELLESLEELKELNRRQRTVDYEGMLKQYLPETTEERKAREEKEDNDFIKSIKFGQSSSQKVIAEEIIEDVDEEPPAKTSRIEVVPPRPDAKTDGSWNRCIGVMKKPALSNLVRKKTVENANVNTSCTKVSENVGGVSASDSTITKKESAPAASGLSLLANYSGSDSDSQTSYINDFYESEEEIPCSQEEQSVKKTKTVKKQAPKKAIKKKAAQQLRVTPALTESDSDEEEQPVKRKKTLKQIVPRSFLDDSEEETQVKPIIAKKLNSLLWRRVPSGYTSQRNFAKKGEFYIELRISNSREAEEKDGYKNTLITYKSCVDSNSKSYKAAEKLVKAAKEEFKNIQPILYPKVK